MSISITVSPATFAVVRGQAPTQLFSAVVTGDPSNQGVTWSIQSEAILPMFGANLIPPGIVGPGADGLITPFSPQPSGGQLVGTIDQTGLYTAPPLLKTTPVHNLIVATSKADGLTQGYASLYLLNESFVIYDLSRRRGEQWSVCVRCGFPYPMSQLTQQKGLLVCTRYCWDNLQIERRPRDIQMTLSTYG